MGKIFRRFAFVVTIISCFAIGILLINSFQALAQDSQLQPGLYVTEGGWGEMIIKQANKGGLTFSIESVGENCHTCSLEGKIVNKKGILESGEKDKPCVVEFILKNNDIEIRSNFECRSYCGMRAGFDGLYIKPPKGCSPIEIKETRDEFKYLYDKKSYAQALKKLDSLRTECSKFFSWIEDGWIYNDIAITQYKLRDFKACKKTLEFFLEDISKTEENLRESYPPCDADNYIPVINAARTNLKLCSQKNK